MRRAAVLWCLAVLACGQPSDPAGWAKQASKRNRLDEKLAALAQVRKAPGDRKAAVPWLVEVLKQAPRARGDAAVALGEIGDPAAVKPLLEALDPASKDRDVLEANRKIAEALGELRAREAVPRLVELTGSPDGYVQVAAVDALGEIGDAAAVKRLAELAADDRTEPFTAKKALLALGRIGDPSAAPTLLRMLFVERPGVTFFPEAAFASVELGAPMSAPLVGVLDGRDAELEGWASAHRVVRGALYAKSAQLLGDVGGADAAPALVRRLAYQDPDPGVQLVVRVFAAESLGRLRAREAIGPLGAALAKEKDADARRRYAEALALVGDPAVLPPLRGAAASADPGTREAALVALSRVGGEAERPLVAAARAKECGATCGEARDRLYAGMAARLDAARACGADVGCWSARLGDPSAAVRDRAALEVGRAGGPGDAAALTALVARPVAGDDDLAGRWHGVLALSWIARRADLGPAGAEVAAKLQAMIAAEKGRSYTAAVNEDALRLAARLRRNGRS
jgi:HEAT repeat protein